MVNSECGIGKRFGVKTKKSLFFKVWQKEHFLPKKHVSPKQRRKEILVFVDICSPCKKSMPNKASKRLVDKSEADLMKKTKYPQKSLSKKRKTAFL